MMKCFNRPQIQLFLTSWLLGLIMPLTSVADEVQPVMGAGPSMAVATLFFQHFSKTPAAEGYRFIVEQRSIKHKGGIKASSEYLFGRTGRPLNKLEKQDNKHELFLAANPLAIVVGDGAGVKRINKQQLAGIFSGKLTSWSAVGGVDKPIELVGREASEAAFGVLKKDYPFFADTVFDRIFFRDHHVINYLRSEMGQHAISFGAKGNFSEKYILEVEGFSSVVKLGLVYDEKNKQHPVVKAAREYAKSEEWYGILKKSGFFVPH